MQRRTCHETDEFSKTSLNKFAGCQPKVYKIHTFCLSIGRPSHVRAGSRMATGMTTMRSSRIEAYDLRSLAFEAQIPDLCISDFLLISLAKS